MTPAKPYRDRFPDADEDAAVEAEKYPHAPDTPQSVPADKYFTPDEVRQMEENFELLNTPDAPLSQGEGIEGYLRERDERELETGKDDPQGAINYWQLAANHANEEVTKLIAERDKLKEALKKILSFSDPGGIDAAHEIARAALSSTQGAK